MRTAILAGALLVAFATTGSAQMPNRAQGGQGGMMENNQGGMMDNDERGMMDNDQRGRWGHQDWMRGEHREMMMRFAHAMASGTFYRFKRGDDEVDIHCPANQPLQACVSGATELMQSLAQSRPPAAPSHTP